MREILGTINKIIAEIPDDDKWYDLIFNLKQIWDVNAYTAPELQNWKRLCVLLDNSLPYPPETSWQKNILAIIRGDKR